MWKLILDHASLQRANVRWFLLAAIVGVVAGLGGIFFQVSEQVFFRVFSQGIAGFSPQEAAGERRIFADPAQPFSPAKLLLVMGLGGLAAGFLVQKFAPEAEGHGTDAAIDAFHRKRGYVRPITPFIKLFASAITIGTGGSGGREGPIAQIGAGFGSMVGTLFKLPARDCRILLAVGLGAGVGAIFRAPLAGALFAAEILYRDADLEAEVIVPAAVAGTIGYTLFAYWLPPEIRFLPLFGGDLKHRLSSLAELGPLTLMAIVLTVVGVLYIEVFYGLHKWVKSSRIPLWIRPVVGAVVSGLLGLGLYYFFGEDPRALAVLGTGYGALQEALRNPRTLGIGLLTAIALVKILTTSATIGSGGSGGVFGPSMVIGGCTGGAVGTLFNSWWPQLVPNPAVYTVVGMAGFFSGVARAPISTIVMVSELTGDYSLLVPTMWVSTLCFILGDRWTLYQNQVRTRLDSPSHLGDFLVDVLEGYSVRDVPWKDRATVEERLPLKEIVHLIADRRQHYFPVVDAGGQFVGIFSTDDVRRYLFDESLWELANANDIMATRIVTVTPSDDLNVSLRRFTELNLDELPVVDEKNPKRLLGMLRRKDVIARYNQALRDFKTRSAAQQ